jgi:hypothetical protein
MATTTTNYGFDIPQSTDLVKDGATAIATLGQDIDTAMNTALGTKKAGMVLLNTTSFSGVASQSINDVFSSTYTNYAVKFSNFSFSTTDILLNFRFRVAGADNTTSNYSFQFLRGLGSTLVTSGSVNATAFTRLTYASTATSSPLDLEIVGPFATERTYYTNSSFQPAAVSNNAVEFITGFFNATTSFTGFTIYPDSGNITGTVSVYGYNK